MISCGCHLASTFTFFEAWSECRADHQFTASSHQQLKGVQPDRCDSLHLQRVSSARGGEGAAQFDWSCRQEGIELL